MATSKKPSAKTVAPAKPVITKAITMVALAKCSYHYWRGWNKDILRNGGILSAKFKKEETGYNGLISVSSAELVKAKNVLNKYTKDNPETDTTQMWQF